MANLQYIGARYVPKFFLNSDDSSNDWKSGELYEALTIVTYNNDSYTSKQTVPATVGNPADNPQYWACTTKYTAALMALQNTVGILETEYDDLFAGKLSVYSTVSEMVSDSGLENGMKCKTLGYYNVGDGGDCDYLVTNTATSISITLPDGLYAEPIMDVINIKKLGAKGDNTECSDIIQRALENNDHKPVFIPNGDYLINKPLYLFYGSVYGEDYKNTIIRASANFANNNRFTATTGISAMIFVLNPDYASGDESVDTTSGNNLHGFELRCNNNCDYGVVFPIKTSRTKLEHIMVRECVQSGFMGHENMWLCKFIQCYTYYSNVGFDFTSAVKTSLYFDQCYVIESAKAFAVKGDYSVLMNCCGDAITDTVFDLSEFHGSMISCACESPNVLNILKCFYSSVDVVGCTFFTSVTAGSYIVRLNGGSKVTLNGKISGTGNVCKLYTMSGIDNTLVFANFDYPSTAVIAPDGNIEPSNHVCQLDSYIVTSRGNITPYIGADARNNTPLDANAIFMGNTDAPFKMTNGRNYNVSWNNRANVGDLFLSKIPRDINAAGWLCAYDGSDDMQLNGTVSYISGSTIVMTDGGVSGELNAGARIPNGATLYTEHGIVGTVNYTTSPQEIKLTSAAQNVNVGDTVYVSKITNTSLTDLYVPIAIVTFGNSGFRPAHPRTGSMFFDLTINKPIWYNGTKWVDATGADA